MRKIFSILFISFIIFSCDQENIIVPTDTSVETNPVLEQIREMGFDMNTVVDYNDEYYLVEGDIMIPKVIPDNGTSNSRHISFNHEYSQKRAINIYLKKNFVSLYNNLDQALNNAINAYNNVQGVRLSMARVYDEKKADIVVEKEMNENGVHNAIALFNPQSIIDNNAGIIGKKIYVAEDFCANVNAATVPQLTHTLIHEIGHCIGRLHTDTTPYSDYYNRGFRNFSYVSGSPVSDPTSVMNGNSGNWVWNGFSHWDVVALRRLYPAISKSDVFPMFINRFADNTWSFGLLSGAERYQFHSEYKSQDMGKIDDNWDFCVNNTFNNKFYGIHKKNTASGKTEISIYTMIPFNQTKVVTPLHLTNANWTFVVGDYNKDGKDDIFCINRYNSESQKTTIHILNGATNYTTWLKHIVTPLGPTNGNWDFISGDVNFDNRIDVICINKQNISNDRTTIHVLNGNTAYKSWLSHAITPLHRTGANFEFYAGDYNNDYRVDVYAIKKSNTGTNSTEVHILNAKNNFQSYLVQIGTSLPEVSGNVEFCN